MLLIYYTIYYIFFSKTYLLGNMTWHIKQDNGVPFEIRKLLATSIITVSDTSTKVFWVNWANQKTRNFHLYTNTRSIFINRPSSSWRTLYISRYSSATRLILNTGILQMSAPGSKQTHISPLPHDSIGLQFLACFFTDVAYVANAL